MARRAYGEDVGELTTASVLKRDIPWDTYLTARLISDKDLQLIRRYDKASRETQAQLLTEAGPAYVEAFVLVLRNVTKEDVVQYVLASLDDLISENSSRAELFHQKSNTKGEDKPDFYGIFLKLLQRTDWFTQEKSCRILTAVLESRPKQSVSVYVNGASGSSEISANGASSSKSTQSFSDPVESVLNSLVNWLCAQLRRPSNTSRSVVVAVSALSHILKERSVRKLLLRSGGIPLLGPLLKPSGSANPSLQMLYETSLCLWQLTFFQEAADEIAHSQEIISNLVEISRTAQKEKVFRVALMALKNLLQTSGHEAGPFMVDAGLENVVKQRKQQNFEDEDIPVLLDAIKEKLAESIQILSSYEKYKREVTSGKLDWGPMHTSKEFWQENASKLEEKEFQLLKVLLKTLEKAREPKVLAVGCNDIGFFITFHPNGRQVVQDLKGKELVMRLMMHPDPHVQKQALSCVQKIMLTKDKLEFLKAEDE